MHYVGAIQAGPGILQDLQLIRLEISTDEEKWQILKADSMVYISF